MMTICSKCYYDNNYPEITFDKNNVCNYCIQIESLANEYGTGREKGIKKFQQIINEIKVNQKNKKYDCVVGVSGGTDSSYMLHLLKEEYKLRVLAVHYDNTWNTEISTRNIYAMINKLNIDLITHVVDNKEADDILKSFFMSGVAEIDGPTDLAVAFVLRTAAKKHGIKYIFEGHSFLEEGITPLTNNYFYGKFIESIHKKFGEMKMQNYPLMTFRKFVTSIIFDRVKLIRPFWYINYQKEMAIEFLSKNYDWKYYDGHHLENRMTAFYHLIYLPKRFNKSLKINTIAAKVRNKAISRKQAEELINKEDKASNDIEVYFKKRLNLSDNEYGYYMGASLKNWKDFPNDKKKFEIMRPLFFVAQKFNLVPKSFYLKYCFKK